MSIDTQTVKRVAKLSALAISDDQIPVLQAQMNHILEMVEQVNQIDTQGISPLSHPLAQTQRLRKDSPHGLVGVFP